MNSRTYEIEDVRGQGGTHVTQLMTKGEEGDVGGTERSKSSSDEGGDGTDGGCTHEETKKQDERKAEQRDEQHDNSSESSNDDGHASWGYLRKDETIEDRMRLTQLVDAIERGGFDEHSDNFLGFV